MGNQTAEPSRSPLLTLTPSQEQRDGLVGNILAVYDRATAEQRSKGMSWYSTAHDLAGVVGFGDYSKGAGIIAALSANTGWTQNRHLALAISEGREVGHLSQVLDKVKRMLAGEEPHAVLGKGLKTMSFYLNILHPDTSPAVTVDRHAHDIARGEVWGSRNRCLSTETRYRILVDAYREAATLRGVLPSQVQAVTWVVWTEEIAGTSTRASARKD